MELTSLYGNKKQNKKPFPMNHQISHHHILASLVPSGGHLDLSDFSCFTWYPIIVAVTKLVLNKYFLK